MNKPAETIEELQAQLVAVQDSVVHGKCANAEPCSTFCEAIATRKMMQQLRDENYILKSVNKGLAIGRNMAVEAAKNLGYKFDPKVSGLEYLIETASATVMVNQKNVELAAQIDNAWRELREIREALKADPYKSTADEVRSLVSGYKTLHSLMVSGEKRGEAKAKEELIPPFLLELSKQLNEQPSRSTAHPFYQVRCNRYYVTEADYNEDHWALFGDDGEVWRNDSAPEELCEYLAEYHRDWVVSLIGENEDAEEGEEEIDEELATRLQECGEFDFDCDDLPDGLKKLHMQKIEEVVSTHLTLDAANKFIKRKQHDYPKLFTYAESAYWSPQLRELQDWIKSLTAKAVSDENN